MLVANLLDQAEVLQVIAASLRGGVSLVPLDRAPDPEAVQMIELHAPGLDEPIQLVGRPEGTPVAGMFPLRLGPLNPSQAAVLRAFLRSQGPPAPVALGAGSSDSSPMVFSPPAGVREPTGSMAASLAFEDTIATRAPRRWDEPDDTGGGTTTPEAHVSRELLDVERTIVEMAPSSIGAARAPVSAAAVGNDAQEEGEAEGLAVGRTLNGGKYVIESLIGTGGAGRVYRARHSALDTPVAIKVLHARHQKDDRFAARFRHEARATSMLDHPNVMRVLDFGQDDDGLMYIVMEYLQGQDLQQIIDVEAPLSEARIIGILSQVCAALSSAHEVGIIHRDMKPENVIVMQRRDDDGSLTDIVKVCDFGLAKIQEMQKRRQGSSANLTIVGTIWGTPEYMSPEQIRDELLDARCDVYACGVILYEMAAGRLPYSGDSTLEILGKHLTTEPEPPSHVNPHVSPRLEALILRAMSKDRTGRPASARVLRAELRALREGTPTPAPARETPLTNPRAGVVATEVAPAVDDTDDPSTIQTVPRIRASMLATELADRLVNDPPGAARPFREMLDDEQTSEEDGPLEMTLVLLATQGEMRALWQLVAGLERIGRDVEGELEPKHRAMATRALQSLAEGIALVGVARALLEGPGASRAPAREILTLLGAAGARALCQVRIDGEMSPAGRGRFVAVLREMGTGAMTALTATLAGLDAARAESDPGLVEDLLRAVPEEISDSFADVALVHVQSRSPAVRRAAAAALLLVHGARAAPTLASLFDDPDESVRIACLAGLRRLRAVDAGMVRRIDAIVADSAATEDGLAATAIAALGGVTEDARAEAIALLSRTVEPAGWWARLLGRARPRRSDFVIETAARSLLAIGGPGARELVARAARREKGALRDRLGALL